MLVSHLPYPRKASLSNGWEVRALFGVSGMTACRDTGSVKPNDSSGYRDAEISCINVYAGVCAADNFDVLNKSVDSRTRAPCIWLVYSAGKTWDIRFVFSGS